MTSHYTYTLSYPPELEGGRPFYVGKGQGVRIEKHESHARNGDRGPTPATIRLIWAAGFEIVKTKVLETDSEYDAYLEEIRLIRLYGLDNLTNRLEPRKPRNNNPAPPVPEVTAKLDDKTFQNLQMLKGYYRTTSDHKIITRLINDYAYHLQRLGLLKTS